MSEKIYIIIVGAGKVGWNLARELLEKGNEVTLIENKRERYLTVEQELEHNIQYGDASELWVLERADVFIASTDGDNTNIIIAQLAKRRFKVPTVITRVLDPYRAKWYESQGLHTICPTRVAIDMLETEVLAAAERSAGGAPRIGAVDHEDAD